MNTNEMFDLIVIALRDSYLYPYKGSCNTEDLFHLSSVSLRGVYKTLKAELDKYDTSDDLFPDVTTLENKAIKMLENKLAIVRFVATMLKNEEDQRKQMANKQNHNAAIDELIAAKKAQEMANMSIEELEALKL